MPGILPAACDWEERAESDPCECDTAAVSHCFHRTLNVFKNFLFFN